MLSTMELKVDPELLRQVFGYWLEPGEPVPSWPPRLRPSGAVLPPLDAAPELLCLDLCLVNNYWHVTSTARSTQKHLWCMRAGELWRFVPVKDFVGRWPMVFDVSFASPLKREEIEPIYGPDAAARAPKGPITRLRLREAASPARPALHVVTLASS